MVRRIAAVAINAITVLVIASAIFIVLVNIGVISRQASESVTFAE